MRLLLRSAVKLMLSVVAVCLPLQAAGDGHLHHNINSSDTVVWPTNIGWMMGPWLIYASLMNK
jgi:acyl-coenzyme A synthetase/AMP-(fatty) acid ligase